MRANTTAIDVLVEELPEFPELVQTYQRTVFSFAYHFLHEQAGAEEVAQEVFFQLFRALPSIRSKAHVTAWLYRVTSHRCIDYARRRRRDLSLDEIPEPVADKAHGDPLRNRRLQRAVASLPPKGRIVIILRYQEDMEPDEIAQVLGWRLNTVKSRLNRSLKLLKAKLGGVWGDEAS